MVHPTCKAQRRRPPAASLDAAAPLDLDAETILLGVLVWEPRVRTDVVPLVDAADFADAGHRILWKAVVSVGAGDDGAVAEWLQKRKRLDAGLLVRIEPLACEWIWWPYWVGRVKLAAARRAAWGAALDTVRATATGDDEALARQVERLLHLRRAVAEAAQPGAYRPKTYSEHTELCPL